MVLYGFGVVCVLLYGVSAGLALFSLTRHSPLAGHWAKGVYLVTVALHSAIIGMESVSTGGTLLSGPNIIMLASWVMAVITCIGLLFTHRGLAFAGAMAPAVALMIVVAQALKIASPGAADNLAYYGWPLLLPHIVLVFLAAACFATSATAAVLDLYQRRLAATKSPKLISLETPALDVSGRISRISALLGLLIFSGAMLIGFAHLLSLSVAMTAAGCEGNLLYLAPRIALSFLTTLAWSLFCGFSFLAPWLASARVRSGLAITGFGFMLLLIAVSAG